MTPQSIDEQQNFVHVHKTCQKCGDCVYECEHRVKATLTTTASGRYVKISATPPQLSDEWLDEILHKYTAARNVTDSHGNVYFDFSFKEAKQAILAELKRREAAARVDELSDLHLLHLAQHNTDTCFLIKERLIQLHKEQQEGSK